MEIQSKLKQLKDQKSYSIPAKRVLEHLKPILSKSSDLRQRWMWELIQNACDLGDNIRVQFEVFNDRIVFKHNGKPFSLDEAYNLIMPDSNKDDESSKKISVIGQFGTGFISTHILSKIILVEGKIEEDDKYYDFSFKLDRSERTDKDFLIESIKRSEKEYKESLKEGTFFYEHFQTSFTYFTNETYASLDGKMIVDEGLKCMAAILPYVFAFRSQLESVEIIDQRGKGIQLLYSNQKLSSDIQYLDLFRCDCMMNGNLQSSQVVGIIKEGESLIAFPVEMDDHKTQLLQPPLNSARLYCAFPMVGTTNFNFPVIIHSEKFVPNRERDGIELSDYDTDNRQRLVEAVSCFKKLVKITEQNQWTHAYNIVRFSQPSFDNATTQKWFLKEVFNPIKTAVQEALIIETEIIPGIENKRTSLSSGYIPYEDKRSKDCLIVVNKIHALASKVSSEFIPNEAQFLSWFEAIDFEVFAGEKLDTEKLCELASPTKATVAEFAVSKNMTEADVIKYFVDVVKFILEQKKPELLLKYKLIINQCLEFCVLKGMLLDRTNQKGLAEGYDEKLKDIYKSISNEDCRMRLLYSSFEQIPSILDKDERLDFKQLAKDTDEELRNYSGSFQEETFLVTLKDMFNWYTTCQLSEETLYHLFPYFSANKSQLYLNTKTPQELEYAFDIEISGKSEVLAQLANSNLSEKELKIIADNPLLVASFIDFLNRRVEDNPDEELGEIGEEFLYYRLCQTYGNDRVLWEKKSEYDFKVLEADLQETKYYIDAKTTGRGIGNSDNVPFYMRLAQWRFLDGPNASNKYLIARVFKQNEHIDVKFVNLKSEQI